jgi:predicted acylesterase/phospholipase RssA
MKILSLDGGGTWALIQARALGALYGEDTPGYEILRWFDLVAANSGGSIVAGGLAANFTPRQIARLFHDEVKTIFVRRPDNPARWFWREVGLDAPWRAEQKLFGLQRALGPLGTQTLAQVQASTPQLPHFLISAYDYDRRRVRFFRSNLRSLAGSQDPPSLVPSFIEAIHASSNAPVLFFDAPALLSQSDRFWDGAIAGYNNPVMAAVLELRANDPSAPLQALSLGTGQVKLPLKDASKAAEWEKLVETPAESGVQHDLKEMAMSVLDDPPDAASFTAHVVLGGRLPKRGEPPVADGPVVRLNPLVQPWLDATGTVWTRMLPPDQDDVFERLLKLQMDATAPDDIAAIEVLCEAWLSGRSPNQAIRTTRDYQVEIGHRRFADGHRWARTQGLAP